MIITVSQGDGMINMLSLAAAYGESGGSEVNLLNVMLSIVYIVVVMALIYVVLLCIDKFAKKNKKSDEVGLF